jgi:hypothetical protein
MRFVTDNVAQGQVFLGVHLFPMSVSFHQCSILNFIYTFLLPEGQMGEAWEPSKKQYTFGNRGALNRKVLPVFK